MNDLLGEPGAAEKHPELEPLLGDLMAKRIPKKKADKLDVSGMAGELPIRAIYRRCSPAATPLEALQPICKTGDCGDLPAIAGVYVDVERQALVATNKDVLVVLTPMALLDGESRVFDSAGEVLPGEFPNYAAVMPVGAGHESEALDAEKLLAKVRGMERANKFIEGRPVFAVVESPDGLHSFSPALLVLALEALLKTGMKAVRLRVSDLPKPLSLEDADEPRRFALVMPCSAYDGGGGRLHIKEEILYTKLLPYALS